MHVQLRDGHRDHVAGAGVRRRRGARRPRRAGTGRRRRTRRRPRRSRTALCPRGSGEFRAPRSSRTTRLTPAIRAAKALRGEVSTSRTRAPFDDPPGLEDDHAVGEREGVEQVVGDEHGGAPLLPQDPAQQPAHRGRRRRRRGPPWVRPAAAVAGRRRGRGRSRRAGPGRRTAAAAACPRASFGLHLAQPALGDRRVPRSGSRPGCAGRTRRSPRRSGAGTAAPAATASPRRARAAGTNARRCRVGEHPSLEFDAAPVGPDQPGDQREQRRLAGPVRAEDGEHLPAVESRSRSTSRWSSGHGPGARRGPSTAPWSRRPAHSTPPAGACWCRSRSARRRGRAAATAPPRPPDRSRAAGRSPGAGSG